MMHMVFITLIRRDNFLIRREIPLTVAYKGIRYCGYFLCVVFTYFCIFMLSRRQLNQISLCEIPSYTKDIYIEWGNSPTFFSAYKPSYPIPFSELEKEILFLGTTIKPEQKILLSTKQSGVRKLIASGEKIYLIYREEKLHFSEIKTPLAISVTLQNDALVEIIMSFDPEMSTICNLDNTYRFLKSKENQYTISNNDSLIDTPMFQSLQKAKWWGIDYLLISNPRDETAHERGKQRLQFTYDEYGEIVHLDLDESLVWGKNGWRSATINDEGMDADYVIRIKEIHSDKLELTLWDRKGLPIHTFFLPLYTTCNELPSIEILSNIKKRTRTVASFLLGKTRVTMKKGDLAIDTPYGWKITNTQDEKNGIFSHQIIGSLFAFDGMETQGSNIYFIGRMLDPMRTCYQPIKIPILQNKRKERKNQNILPEVQLSSIGDE